MSENSSHNRSIQTHEHGGHSSQNKREDADEEEPPYDCNDGRDYNDCQVYNDDEVGEEEWGDGDEELPIMMKNGEMPMKSPL